METKLLPNSTFPEFHKWILSTHKSSKSIFLCSTNMKLFLEHKCFKVSLSFDIMTLVCFDGSIAGMNISPMLQLWRVFAISKILSGRLFISVCDVSRDFLGRLVHISNYSWHWAEKFSKSVPPDALKTQSLALSGLKFLCKAFSKLP